jgi:hypothetical protein
MTDLEQKRFDLDFEIQQVEAALRTMAPEDRKAATQLTNRLSRLIASMEDLGVRVVHPTFD